MLTFVCWGSTEQGPSGPRVCLTWKIRQSCWALHPGLYFCPSFIISTSDNETSHSALCWSSLSFVDKSITVIKELLHNFCSPQGKVIEHRPTWQITGYGGGSSSSCFGLAICLCSPKRRLSLLFVKEVPRLTPKVPSVGWIDEWKAHDNTQHLRSLLMISSRIVPSGNSHLLGRRANFRWYWVQRVL